MEDLLSILLFCSVEKLDFQVSVAMVFFMVQGGKHTLNISFSVFF